MISGSAAQTKSTSSAVESRPSEKRTSELAVSFLPSAKITWLGSKEPAEHADPLEAQMPSMSNPAIKAMPSDPRTVKATVLASESVRGLTSSQPGIFSIDGNQFVRERFQPGPVKNRRFNKFFHSRDQTEDGGKIFRARPAFILMAATEQNRIRMQRRFDVQ